MNDASEPTHVSEIVPHVIGDVDDPVRRHEVRVRDSASEVSGLETERKNVAEAAQSGDPDAAAALDGITKTLLDAQADHFEQRQQGKET